MPKKPASKQSKQKSTKAVPGGRRTSKISVRPSLGSSPIGRPPARDARREKRIAFEIVVDAYTSEEQAMSWYYHLESELKFPFSAKCIAERAISPLRKGDTAEVIGMAPESECEHEMFVQMSWEGRTLAVPLAQLEPARRTGAKTRQAIADWHYWLAQGFQS